MGQIEVQHETCRYCSSTGLSCPIAQIVNRAECETHSGAVKSPLVGADKDETHPSRPKELVDTQPIEVVRFGNIVDTAKNAQSLDEFISMLKKLIEIDEKNGREALFARFEDSNQYNWPTKSDVLSIPDTLHYPLQELVTLLENFQTILAGTPEFLADEKAVRGALKYCAIPFVVTDEHVRRVKGEGIPTVNLVQEIGRMIFGKEEATSESV